MKKLLACVAIIGLAACTEPASAPEPEPAEQSAPASPSATDNMLWRYTAPNSPNVGTTLARLMYSSGGSEGMGINLQCEAGTVYVRLARGEQRTQWPFSLRSADVRADLTGTTEGASEVVVTATSPVTEPIWTAFRDTGALTLIDGDLTLVMDAVEPQERQAITQFFEACS